MDGYLSPGKLYALWEAGQVLARHKSCRLIRESLKSTLFNVSYYIGSTDLIESSIQLGKLIGFFIEDNNYIYLPQKSIENFNFRNGTIQFFRSIIKAVLIDKPPYWLAFFDDDKEVFSDYIPSFWIDSLNTCNLMNLFDPIILNWWDELFTELQFNEDQNRKEIGDFCEELTLEYELNRLENEKIIEYEKSVIWLSKISNKYGYDIGSLSGTMNRTAPEKPIMIEVKGTQSENINHLRFYVTRNEWNTAISNIDSYYFYVWVGVDIKNQCKKIDPKIIPAIKLMNHFPEDQDSNFQWILSQVILNLDKEQKFLNDGRNIVNP